MEKTEQAGSSEEDSRNSPIFIISTPNIDVEQVITPNVIIHMENSSTDVSRIEQIDTSENILLDAITADNKIPNPPSRSSSSSTESSVDEIICGQLPLIEGSPFNISMTNESTTIGFLNQEPIIHQRRISHDMGFELIAINMPQNDAQVDLSRSSENERQRILSLKNRCIYNIKKHIYYSVHYVFFIIHVLLTMDMFFNKLKLSLSSHAIILFSFFLSIINIRNEIPYRKARKSKMLISRFAILIYYLITLLLPLLFLAYIGLLYEGFDKKLLIFGKVNRVNKLP